jgi:hypothetical protein
LIEASFVAPAKLIIPAKHSIARHSSESWNSVPSCSDRESLDPSFRWDDGNGLFRQDYARASISAP